MTTDPDTHSTNSEIDPTARYMAQRLSALPASIREEVIEAVAEVVDFFTGAGNVLEEFGSHLRSSPAGSDEAHRLQKEYYIATFMSMYAQSAVNAARHRYQTGATASEPNPRTKRNTKKGVV